MNRQRLQACVLVIALVPSILVYDANIAQPSDPPKRADMPKKLVSEIDIEGVQALAFSSDGNTLAVESREGRRSGLRLWNVLTGEYTAEASRTVPPAGWAKFLTFSPDGTRLVSVHEMGTLDQSKPRMSVYLWDVSSTNGLFNAKRLTTRENAWWGRTSSIFHAAFSPDGRMIVTTDSDETVYLWETDTAKQRFHFKGGIAAAFGPDGRTLITVSHNGLIQRWETATGKLIGPRKEDRKDFTYTAHVAFSSNGDTVMVCDPYQFKLKSTATGETIQQFALRSECWLEASAYTPDGKLLAKRDDVAGIHFIETATGNVRWFETPEGYRGPLAFSRDGRYFAWSNVSHVRIREFDKVLADCKPVPEFPKIDPAGISLEAELVATKDTYTLDLGGQTAENFSNTVGRAHDPKAPKVDLLFKLKNTGKKAVTLHDFEELPVLSLEGAGAFNAVVPSFQTAGLGDAPKPVTLKPGESHSIRVTALATGFFNAHQSYWLLPGEYTVRAKYHASISPHPKPELDDGSGWVTIHAAPIKVKVVAAKGERMP